MAESLHEVDEPLAGLVPVGAAAPADEVARAIGRSLALPRSPVAGPGWLRPEQRASFGRARAALDRYGTAILAEPVGSGKSWIALALATAESGGAMPTVIIPAALLDQWRATAERVRVPVRLWTHERLSRGRLPQTRTGLVIIDESHRFRSAESKRYRTLAPWLIGRRLLLLTATPMVNRLSDLANQLLLGLRDDALRRGGLASLRHDLAEERAVSCLGEVVIASMAETIAGPARRDSTISLPQTLPPDLLAGLDQLTHSRQRPIARLLQGVIWFAAASSPAALLAVLTRYQALLRHAEDARSVGQRLSRAALREFTGGLSEQLVMWSMLESPQLLCDGDLDLEDLGRIETLIPMVRQWLASGDLKRERLSALLADGRPSLVFASARATVRYLRDGLPYPVAWCIGSRAGLGHSELAREVVWRWFAPDAAWLGSGEAPAALVCTDVAAEGLNLQRTARVIHYDLPWTPMRLAQRDGRAIRLGSRHDLVDVVRFLPCAMIERRLGISRLLTTKLRLPARMGLGVEGRDRWRWRDQLAERMSGGPATTGRCAVEGSGLAPGALAGVELCAEDGSMTVATLIWLPVDGEATEAVDEVEPRLLLAMERPAAGAPTGPELESALARLWPVIRSRLSAAHRNRWRGARRAPEARLLARRLHGLLAQAARRRDAVAMRIIDRGLHFVRRGQTAGEALITIQLNGLSDRLLLERLARLPEMEERERVLMPGIAGLIVFR